eukprot:CAMPEP_0171975532 /NCGR_PEP_ID=MMETSP0993-20121228/237679_1 /TAXON_ID=483369 /ORGANISM="non described non described, Strain CCMP2098" /LENGTH=98 /DNA_ID=CAMNT_0012626805 /DNA_START=263 /DNA_END=556 /DNA_ORIENTATION=+
MTIGKERSMVRDGLRKSMPQSPLSGVTSSDNSLFEEDTRATVEPGGRNRDATPTAARTCPPPFPRRSKRTPRGCPFCLQQRRKIPARRSFAVVDVNST